MIALAQDPLAIWVASLLLAALFARGAWHKLSDLDMARAIIEAYELVPPRVAHVAAPLLGALEAAIALGLLFGATRPLAAMAAFALLTAYAIAIGINLQRGRIDIDCGCGGAGEGLSWLLVARNAVLLFAAVIAMGAPDLRGFGWRDLAVLPLALAALWLLVMIVEQTASNAAARRKLLNVFQRGA